MISRLELDNVLAFRRLSLDLRTLTVLSGTNSAGKSSVLHSLAMLRQSDRAGVLPTSLLLNGELVELGTARDLLHSEPNELEGVESIALRVRLTAAGGHFEWLARYEGAADVLPLIRAPPRDSAAGGLFEPGFQYLKADRIVPSVTFPKSHEAVTVERFLGASGQHAPNFLRVHGDEPIQCAAAAHPNAAGPSLLDQANAWLDDLSPGTSVSVLDVEGTDLVRLSFRQQGSDVRTEPHRATNVGFGLTYSFPLVIACLMALPGSLLLIENPEAHLHPRAQAVLGRLCSLAAAGGAQIVVETHSDHVLNSIRLAVKRREFSSTDVLLHFFSRSEGVLQPQLVTLEVAPDGMIDAWPPGFFDEADRALDELLG